MSTCIHNFTIILLIALSSFINYVFSNELVNLVKIKEHNCEKPEEYLFNIFSTKTVQLIPDNTLITTNSYGKLYLKKDKDFPNAYYGSIIGMKADFVRDSSVILDTSSCGSWEAQNEVSTNKPFVIVFDESNMLKYIIVDKEGLPSQHSFKLQLVFLLQNNIKQLDQKHTRENTFYGECNMKYNVSRNLTSKAEDYIIHKFYDTKTCEVMNAKFREKNDLLTKICKSENALNWTMNSEIEVSEDCSLPQNSNFSLTFSFETLKESFAKMNMTWEIHLSQIPFTDSLGNSTVISEFNYKDTIKISEVSYESVNETIITSNPEGKLGDLKKLYQALSCEDRLLNIFAALTGRAYRCIEESYQAA